MSSLSNGNTVRVYNYRSLLGAKCSGPNGLSWDYVLFEGFGLNARFFKNLTYNSSLAKNCFNKEIRRLYELIHLHRSQNYCEYNKTELFGWTVAILLIPFFVKFLFSPGENGRIASQDESSLHFRKDHRE